MGREPDRQGLSLPAKGRAWGACCKHVRQAQPDRKDGVSTAETYAAYLFYNIIEKYSLWL